MPKNRVHPIAGAIPTGAAVMTHSYRSAPPPGMRSAVPTPVVAGVAGGVGTSLVAAALHAVDGGVAQPGVPAHVLVCRCTVSSVGRAHSVLAELPSAVVLAVVADIPRAQHPRPARARLRMVEPYLRGQVWVPYVSTWRDQDDPWSRAGQLLIQPGSATRAEQEFLKALQMLTERITPLLDPPPPGPVPHLTSPERTQP